MVRRFAGAVFDLNGTLVDDLRFHFEAWRAFARPRGITLDDGFLQSINGLKPRWSRCGHEDIFPKILARSSPRSSARSTGARCGPWRSR